MSHWYIPIIAALPATLATILIFLDQQITAVIINRKENKLKVNHRNQNHQKSTIVWCSYIFT